LGACADSKKKRQALKKAKSVGGSSSKLKDEEATPSSSTNDIQGLINGLEEKVDLNERSCTGVLASHPQARDIHIDSFTLLFHGHELLADARLELNFGR
jgi:ATP-binding cassette, subfamily F, member 2